MSPFARSTRRSVTNRCGVRPVVALNSRAKWYALRWATAARSARPRSVPRLSPTNSSTARSTCRGSLPVAPRTAGATAVCRIRWTTSRVANASAQSRPPGPPVSSSSRRAARSCCTAGWRKPQQTTGNRTSPGPSNVSAATLPTKAGSSWNAVASTSPDHRCRLDAPAGMSWHDPGGTPPSYTAPSTSMRAWCGRAARSNRNGRGRGGGEASPAGMRSKCSTRTPDQPIPVLDADGTAGGL